MYVYDMFHILLSYDSQGSMEWIYVCMYVCMYVCQENSSNGRLILAKKMYDSSRDVSLIFTDRNQTYTALTDGFL